MPNGGQGGALRGWQPEHAGCPGQLPPLQVSCPVGIAATLCRALTLYTPFPHNEKQCLLHSYWLWGLGFTLSNLVQPLREPSFSTVAVPWSREEFCSFSRNPACPGPGISHPRRPQGQALSQGHGHKGDGGKLRQRMRSSHLADDVRWRV